MWSARSFPSALLATAPLLLNGGPSGNLTPADSAASSALTYWFSFGAVAVIAFVQFYLYTWPGKLTQKARDEARADLEKELARIIAEKDATKAELTEEQRFTRTDLVPLLSQFTSVSSALIPLLQAQIAQSRGGDDEHRERR